jgi:hypothetical protein
MTRSLGLAAAATLAATGIASASFVGIITETGSGFAITGGPHSSDIVLDPSVYGELFDLSVIVTFTGFQHDWLGDLVVTLSHVESGRTATLFSGVGGGTFGSPAQLNGTYIFTDAANTPAAPFGGSLWAAASDAGVGTVGSGFYFPSAPGTGAFVSMNAAFAGITSAGTWRLTIQDTFPAADDGSLGNWFIQLTGPVVPAPGAVALLGLAAMIGSRRRRD